MVLAFPLAIGIVATRCQSQIVVDRSVHRGQRSAEESERGVVRPSGLQGDIESDKNFHLFLAEGHEIRQGRQ